jgi:type IV pilus assembly protein PilA
MKEKLQKYLSGEREGFSLVELIIVIAIMAILIGVIALAVLPYLASSRESKDKQTLDSVYSAFQTALADETVAKSVTTGFTAKDRTALGADSALVKKIEKNLGISLDAAAKKLTSDKCSGGTFIFTKTDTEITVSVQKDGAVPTDSDGNPFTSSNVK